MSGMNCKLERLVRHFHARRVRKATELAAYWRAKADMWRRLCSGRHMSYERDYLVEAVAKQKLYEARLESLMSNDKVGFLEGAKRVKDKLERLVRLQADPDTGPIKRGHICKHGVRWPHECAECADTAWERHQLEEELKANKGLCPKNREAKS